MFQQSVLPSAYRMRLVEAVSARVPALCTVRHHYRRLLSLIQFMLVSLTIPAKVC